MDQVLTEVLIYCKSYLLCLFPTVFWSLSGKPVLDLECQSCPSEQVTESCIFLIIRAGKVARITARPHSLVSHENWKPTLFKMLSLCRCHFSKTHNNWNLTTRLPDFLTPLSAKTRRNTSPLLLNLSLSRTAVKAAIQNVLGNNRIHTLKKSLFSIAVPPFFWCCLTSAWLRDSQCN